MAYSVVDINTNEEVGFFISYSEAFEWAMECERDGCNVSIVEVETGDEMMPWEWD